MDQHVAWAAGLFEGEGCITQRSHGSRLPIVELKMTDEDVVRKFARVVGFGKVYGPYDRGHKPVFVWTAFGFEKTQALVAMFWPWLGQRRRARARQALGG